MKRIVTQYFNYWNAQDLNGLRSLFSEDVTLKDWETEVSGVDDVVAANNRIFQAVPHICIEVVTLAESETKVMAEIIVHLPDNQALEVVDVITIDNGLIAAVKAFKI